MIIIAHLSLKKPVMGSEGAEVHIPHSKALHDEQERNDSSKEILNLTLTQLTITNLRNY